MYAINKEVIADGIMNGTEKVADTLISPSVPYADAGLKGVSYDVKKAGERLTESGWELQSDGYRYKDGKKLEITIYYNSDNAQERTISESMQNDLKQVGAELKIIGEEKQAYFDRQKTGEFDLMYSLSPGDCHMTRKPMYFLEGTIPRRLSSPIGVGKERMAGSYDYRLDG